MRSVDLVRRIDLNEQRSELPVPGSIVVRPPSNEAETIAAFRLAARFVANEPVAAAAADLRRFVEQAPREHATHVRGAFRDTSYVGGYFIDERIMRIGRSRLPTGCIGMVITEPDHRRQGVATALMHDAAAFARDRALGILLLHGLADFYRPFGFVDVFDVVVHSVYRNDILAQPASPYRVRSAAIADAPAILELYDRHFGPYPGSVLRTVDQFAFDIGFSRSLDRLPSSRADSHHHHTLVAVDANDHPRGYLLPSRGARRGFGSEVAVDNWPALLALLRHQAEHLRDNDDSVIEIGWPLPTNSLAALLLADNFSVETRSSHRPWAGWQGSVIDVGIIVRAMLPEWTWHWSRQTSPWKGLLRLSVDGTEQLLRLDSHGVALAGQPQGRTKTVALTARTFLPLLFGFRSVAWLVAQPDQHVPREVLPALEMLFPPRSPWIAPGDSC